MKSVISSDKILRLIVLVIFGGLVDVLIIKNDSTSFILNDIFLFIFSAIFLISIFRNIKSDLKDYSRDKSKFQLIPSIIGIGFVFSFFIISGIFKLRDHSPIIIKAKSNAKSIISDYELEFRENGTYKIAQKLIEATVYDRGKYTIEDTIILLDNKNINDNLKSNRLAIRTITDSQSNRKKLIYQINEKHQIVDSVHFFTVTEDKTGKK
jgi:hypothetical protein